MIKSMTGFGREELLENDRKISVEIKAVNHRYLDLNIRMPKKLAPLESHVRSVCKEYMERGKVDIYIGYEDYSDADSTLKYNDALASEYLGYLHEISEKHNLEFDVRASTIARLPDVFVLEDKNVDEDELWQMLEKPVRGAASKFAESRAKEGENLKNDLCGKLDTMKAFVEEIEARSPQIIEEYKTSLREKVEDLLADHAVDESRIAAEVTIYADKICVDEELVRLKSHIDAMRKELEKGGAIGRKLDFIAQEMNREANTILSKATDLAVSDAGIELKTNIEKVREQVQNVE